MGDTILASKEKYVTACFSIVPRDSKITTVDLLTAINGFLEVCRDSEVRIIVNVGRGKYRSFIEFRIPQAEYGYCSRLAQALLVAELYPRVRVAPAKCVNGVPFG